MAAEQARGLTRLAAAYERLNDRQREAVDWPSDCVVFAGPGSGKTDTLVIKAARLLLIEVAPPRGVACITYTRAAAREITARVAGMGVRPTRRLFASTLHAFCLRIVLSPFADLVGEPRLRGSEFATRGTSRILLQNALDAAGLNERAQYWDARLQLIRRAAACGDDLAARFDPREVEAARRFEQSLDENELVDYDAVVHHALRFVETCPRVGDVIASAFPWILVDEYQDLGGPLHRLVCSLRDQAKVRLFAVGDADQTIMQFTGADPRFLLALEGLGCHVVRLRRNYRSGLRLIKAAAAALGIDRDYEADPERADDGEIALHDVPGGIMAQAERVVQALVPRLATAGTPLDEIAVLYPQKTAAVDALRAALDRSDLKYSFERDERFDSYEPLIDWLQRCAQYCLGAPATQPIRFRDLADELRTYFIDSGRPEGRTDLAAAMALDPVLERRPARDELLADWLASVLGELGLVEALHQAESYEADIEALEVLQQRLRSSAAGATVGQFAGMLRQSGHVVVTTYHSSKGRQFDVVVLPFLQDGFMPRARKKRGRGWQLTDVDNDRLLFYVAFTRARHAVELLRSDSSGIDPYGDPAAFPPSRFANEVEAAI